MNTIDSSLYLQNQTQSKAPSPNLGKDDFMKILMTQLQNQSPADPMKDKEFISQMATFSTLEQMTGMSDSIDQLVQNQVMSPVIQYSDTIGKTVSYKDNSQGQTDESADVLTSQVQAVSQKDGWAQLELENGDKVYADNIIKIESQHDNDV